MTAALQIENNFRIRGHNVSTDYSKIAGNADHRADNMLEPIVAYVMENFAEEISLEDLSATVGISRFSLCRAFQRRFKVTPMRWLWTFRAILAFEFIALEPRWSLTDIAFSCGFTSSAHFSRFFKATFKCSPSQHRIRSLSAMRAAGIATSRPIEFDAVITTENGIVQRVAKAAVTLCSNKQSDKKAALEPDTGMKIFDVAGEEGVSLHE
jgi:AraC-like DNA-binding protein